MTVESTAKRCPACAEEVRSEACICRFCDFDFETGIRTREALPTKRSGLAVASLITGIIFLYGIASIFALVFGYRARREIDAANGGLMGSGMATAGIVLGYIGIVIGLAFWAMVMSL
jgi:hypothetical protein